MVDRVKIYLTSSLITKQNLVVVSDTVHMNVGGPKSLGETGTPSTFDGGVADPREHALPHLPYCANFGHSGSNRSSVIMNIFHNII